MCGIAARADFRSDANSGAAIRNGLLRALDRMKERGPDGQGLALSENWGVGHLRLAIMDLAAGSQPWRREGSACVLTYNGEIYNYLQLNGELKKRGHAIHTRCDTETVLESYLEWGEDCATHFNGFFSFAIVDPVKRILFAARDRLGVKPLHYSKTEENFILASSVAAVLACSGKKMEPDIEALSHYLTTGRVVFGERTMAKGVMALPPAHILKLDLDSGELRISRYWARPALNPEEKSASAPPFEEAVAETRCLIDDAVAMRLKSDVPLGAFLSGGLDSSIIASCAKRHSAAPELPLYCGGSDDENLNECEFASEMASSIGLEVERVDTNPGSFMRDWSTLCQFKGLPLSTPNEMMLHHLSKALGKSCKVALIGEGSDEIFGGYVQAQYSAIDLERSMAAKNDENFYKSHLGMSLSLLYGRCSFNSDADHLLSSTSWMSFPDKIDVLRPEVWGSLHDDEAMFSFYDDFFARHAKCSFFDRRMHFFAEFNLETLLHRIDNSSMAASIETRVPFTDYRLVELAFHMPDSYKMDFKSSAMAEKGKRLSALEMDVQGFFQSKRLPRNAFKDELPSKIFNRQKRNFPIPVHDWMRKELFNEALEICMDSPLASTVFKRDVLETKLKRNGCCAWVLANACKWSLDMASTQSGENE